MALRQFHPLQSSALPTELRSDLFLQIQLKTILIILKIIRLSNGAVFDPFHFTHQRPHSIPSQFSAAPIHHPFVI
uniref:Uncharacterized protein n=1 Tax=Cucumis melo TaxID=3656 RepID=A0A9I9EGI8_CUCME